MSQDTGIAQERADIKAFEWRAVDDDHGWPVEQDVVVTDGKRARINRQYGAMINKMSRCRYHLFLAKKIFNVRPRQV